MLRLSLFKSLSCLPLKCLPQTRTGGINDEQASYFVEASCFLVLQHCIKLVSLPLASRASFHLTLGPDNEVMLYGTRRGHNHERKCRIPRISPPPPPPAFCTKAKIAKGGGVFVGHYSTVFKVQFQEKTAVHLSCYAYWS